MARTSKRGVKKQKKRATKKRATKRVKKSGGRARKAALARSSNSRSAFTSQYEADTALKEYEDDFTSITGFVYAAVVKEKDDWVIELAVEELKEVPKTLRSSVALHSVLHSSFPVRVKIRRVKMPPMKLLYGGKYRPAVGAESIGVSTRALDSTGTLGYGLTIPTKNGPVDFIMTNWHVLLYNGQVGDPVLQPGPLDGGKALDKIAQIRWGLFDGLVDVALAQISPPTSTNVTLMKIKAPNNTFQTIKGVASAQLYNRVWAAGWKTNAWTGIVKSLNATTTVPLPDGTRKTFTNQIQIENNVLALQPGDSGSAVTDVNNKVVGMIFAGNGSMAMANKIEEINKAIQNANL